MTKVMTAQRGYANSSHIGTIYFHGWNTIVIKGSCSASHAESYPYMQIIPAHCMLDLPIFGLNCWKHTALLHTTTLESLVQTAYYISYKKRPFADFEWSCVCKFQQLNGLALGENYTNAKGSLLSLLHIFMIVLVDSSAVLIASNLLLC